LIGKRLDLLKEAFPKINVVAILWNPEAGQLAAQVLEGAKTGAKALGIKLRHRSHDSETAAGSGEG
jgi:hypothetical protein